MVVAPSLFDTPPGSVFSAGTDWMSQALTGSVAAALCVIAVAFVGLLMMTGRLAIREAVRVVLGCFLLLGAPTIALGLRGAADEASSREPIAEPVASAPPAPAPLPPSNYDPYAGASLRIE